MVTYTELE
ncbi:uncharacterized protein FFE2_09574 [Fusarium fujikuroi]|nr:uncharacterized protein FFE2_09574 [Fusarium fujikuroi]